ncbi:MAG: hypothetical protein NVS3B20_12710 [Polyangiales bacterium]
MRAVVRDVHDVRDLHDASLAVVDPVVAERAEMTLLNSAQASLARDPVESLRLCDEHARAFPAGSLTQEREVIAIDALVRQGRRADAESRAERFKKRFPQSGHLRRIETLLGG